MNGEKLGSVQRAYEATVVEGPKLIRGDNEVEDRDQVCSHCRPSKDKAKDWRSSA